MLTSASDAINFTTCNDPNFAALKEFTNSLRQQGAALVPPAKQLRWRVSQAFLAQGALFAFASNKRKDEEVYLQNLFNTNTRCGIGEEMFNQVCLLTKQGAAGTSVRPWVPWMSGEWNPYEFCDVRLLELNQGNQEEIWPYDLTVCTNCDQLTGPYRSKFMFDSQSPGCDSRKNTYAKQVDVDPSAPTNLCYIGMKNSDAVCTHEQGMVGGNRGQSMLNHPVVPHVYGVVNGSFPQSRQGVFPRGGSSNNPLFYGVDSENDVYGYIAVPGDELGVTALGFEVDAVTDGIPYLRVGRLPLASMTGYMSSWPSKNVSSWVPQLDSQFRSDDAIHKVEQASRGSSAWNCPMKRAAFYSQKLVDMESKVFAPAIPSPGRARRIFGALTGNLSSHPTQILQRDGSALGEYTTSNGFCYCPSSMPSLQQQCLVDLKDTVHNCSLKRTIDGLSGLWVQSLAFPPTSTGGGDSSCRMQFDWPYLKGTLRDGGDISGIYTLASDMLNKKCHVLDRLQPFLYRYKSDTKMLKTADTTLDKGGVCHTGRAAKLNQQAKVKVLTTRCVKQSEDDDVINVACEDGTTMSLDKEKSTPPDVMVDAVKSKRTRCTQCSPPPTFTNSKGEQIKAESSFGIPFRFSTSRMIAADLLSVLCGTDGCSNLQLNLTSWDSNVFLNTLLKSPADLFLEKGSTQGSASQGSASQATSVSSPWESDWVFCNTTDGLKTSKCMGRIPEAAWRQNRFQSCYKTIRDLTRDSPDVMSSVDMCLMDANLQNLCTAVNQAQTLVKQANCLASGSSSCALKPFLYLPGSWDVSNKEFVHQSVTRFYSRVTPYACPAVAEVVKANNQAILNRCAATPVGVLNLALQACRDIVDALAKVLFYTVAIIIDGLLMAFSNDKATLKAQIMYYWGCIVTVVKDLLSVLSDIFFDMLFHMGALGERIYSLLQKSCNLINKAYRYWLKIWCGIAIDLIPMVLSGIRQVAEFCESAFSVINDALDVIFQFLVPDALAGMQAAGYVAGFRDKKAKQQLRQKQEIHDSLKQSKKEGKAADAAVAKIKQSNLNKYVLGGTGTSSLFKRRVATAIVGGVIGGFGAAGALKGASFLGDIGNSIYQSIQMSKLAELYPDNWTLFDFESVYASLDSFEYFISTDEQCLSYRAANLNEIVDCTFPTLVSKDSLAGAMQIATRCWADAQRDVGASNLLACTASDTCYRSLYDATPIVCASCPDAGIGYSLYGCSDVTKMCTCSVATTTATSCTSNEECFYATATCLLITGLDDVSYGNQPCIQCSKQVQCLVRDGSGIGQCSCVFQVQPVQQCSQPPGQFVDITTPTKICGYLPSADMTQSVAVAQWNSLAIAQCLYLNPAYVYCVRVYKDSGAVSMAVGLAMAHISASYKSRRLLMTDEIFPDGSFDIHNAESEYELPNSEAMHELLEEDWNRTAAPCSALVSAYQQSMRSKVNVKPELGPLDTLYLHKCVYWRFVGRRTIKLYNLTSLADHDGFLLSMDDFAAALVSKSVLLELLKNPEALFYAVGHAPFLKPLFAIVLVVRSFARLGSLSGNSSEGVKNEEVVEQFWENSTEYVRDIMDRLEDDILYQMHTMSREDTQMTKISKKISQDQDKKIQKPFFQKPQKKHGRHLLQTDTTIQLAQSWLAGPFTWPPAYFNEVTSTQCQIGSAFIRIVYDLLSVLGRYYYGSFKSAPTPPKGLWNNLPTISYSQEIKYEANTTSQGIVSDVYHFMWSLFGVNARRIRSFFGNVEGETNVFTLSTSMLQCDFPGLVYCTNHRKDLFASVFLVLILYFIVSYFSRLLNIPMLTTGMYFAFIPLVLWYAYGSALTCVPMIPSCLMDDVVSMLDYVFPYQLSIPGELMVSPTCLQNKSIPSCIKSCSAVSFFGWRDAFAYGLCSVNNNTCLSFADIIGDKDTLHGSLKTMAKVVSQGSESLIEASNFCFTISFVSIIPVLLLLYVASSTAVTLLYIPCQFIPKFVSMLAQSIVFMHTEEE